VTGEPFTSRELTDQDRVVGGSERDDGSDGQADDYGEGQLGPVELACVSARAARQNLAALRAKTCEQLRDTDGGNGDRFALRFGHRVLAHVDERGNRTYYVADETNLWDRDRTGVVARAADQVIAELYERADVLERDAQVVEAETDSGAASGAASGASCDEAVRLRERATALRAWARRSDTLRGRAAAAIIGTDRYGLRVGGVTDFDDRKNLVAVGDGRVLELGQEDGTGWDVTCRRRELDDMCHSVAAAAWRPEILESPPELAKQFVETFLPEPGKLELIFKLLGHALAAGNPHRYFVILRGGTTSGKTQLVAALSRLLGRYAATSPASIFYQSKGDRPRPDVIRLYGKRLVFLPEASRRWELHASRIKQFTGGDQDPQRAMRSDVFVEQTPVCLPVVYANELPRIVGADEATRRRLLVPRMDQTLPKSLEDTEIKERFVRDRVVAEWLLALLVRGFVEARRDGTADVEAAFSASGAPQAARATGLTGAETTSDVTDELYHLGDFLRWARDSGRLTWVPQDERAYGTASTYVPQETLYSTYTSWCKVYGDRYDRVEQLGLRGFNAELRANHGFTDCKSGVRRWEGWRLQEVSLAELRASLAAEQN
jgi:hypothetical protein